MAALSFNFSGGAPEPEDPAGGGGPGSASPSSAPVHVPRQLTVRALAVGLGIGAMLAAGNVYTGLKSGFIDGGALTAALLSFTFFATFKRLARIPFGPFENNVAQTAAASAAIMAFVHGLMGPMPALFLMGQRHPAWVLWVWGIALASIGLVIGVVLRDKLVVREALPFPTGTATAELIKSVHADRSSAASRTRLLIIAALAAAALTWFRDGRPALVPQAFYLPFTIGGLTAASLTLGVATSPLMAATGVFMGLRGALSLLFGGLVAWAVIAPVAVRSAWVKDGGYGSLAGWLVWPALGLMLASTLIPILFGGPKMARGLVRALRALRSAPKLSGPTPGARAEPRAGSGGHLIGVVTVVVASTVLAWTGWRIFGFSPILTGAALLVSIVLAAVCARAAGETDIAPVGSVGTITQILFAAGGPGTSILAGGIVAGTASEVAQVMWAFKAGYSLRASVRAQIIAQALGAVVGSLVVVPAYLLVIRAYPLGSERMPAVAALSWKATAVALSNGLGTLPPHGLHAAAVAFAVGTLLCIAGRTKIASFLPSPMALGIAMIMPVSASAAAVVGAGAMVLSRRRMPGLGDGETNAVAAGLLAGESMLGVVIAVLTAVGILSL
jgi:putative OPT family oligopeptide transporter